MLFQIVRPSSSRICTQCLRRLRPSTSTQIQLPRRSLSTSRILQQARKPRLAHTSRPVADAYAEEASIGDLAQKLNMTLTAPTVIYESPSHRTLIIAALGLASFFGGYGLVQALSPGMTFVFGRTPERAEDRVSWIIPPILIFVGGALIGIGVWSYGAVRGLVKRITVIPMGKTGEMQAELVVSKLAPWRRHTVALPLAELSLGRRMQDVAPSAESVSSRYRDTEDVNLFLKPFLKLGKGASTFFDETRNVFWRVPFVTLDTNGRGKFTLDARGSAYKGAVGLDRLIRHDYGKGKFWEALG